MMIIINTNDNMRSKRILLAMMIAFSSQIFAQQTCCTPATQLFADLGSNADFQMAHQLPAQSKQVPTSGKWLTFATPDSDSARGFWVPAKIETNRYIFVFHEWWGLNDHILNECARLAEAYPNAHILALDLYDGKVANTREAASELMKGAEEVRIRNIIQGAANKVGISARIATLGWCFGGGWSMQAAIMLENQAVGCVIFYGMPERDKQKIMPLNCKILGFFAEKDQWINRKVVAEYEKAMRDMKKSYETYWYNAEHAFANPSNQHFDETSTEHTRLIMNGYFQNIW